MKSLKRPKSDTSSFAFSGLTVLAAAVAAAAIWYVWFRDDRELSDDELSEVEAFDEYERQRAR